MERRISPVGHRPLPTPEEIKKALAVRSLSHFMKYMWKTVESNPFTPGWHIDCICEHLEAVARGDIHRLIINMPPRHCKSLSCAVFFPAWVWLDQPEKRFLYASYANSLSIRDSVKCRRVMSSQRYLDLQEFMSKMRNREPFELLGDQNTKIRYETNFNGCRIATSVDGALTGEGGDLILVDDPHNIREQESDAIRQATIEWWDEAMSTRLNDERTGAYVIVQQRVHEQDLSGHILDKEGKIWTHLCLPARYEGCNRIISPLGWVDPRKVDGEPLWPEQIPDEVLARREARMGAYAVAGQHQQRPAPREGAMFDAAAFKIVNVAPGEITKVVRYWDKAGSKNRGAYTAGIKMGLLSDGCVIILDCIRGQWEAVERERHIKQCADLDGVKVRVYIEQAPGSGGKESAESTIRNLRGYVVEADRVTGEKVVRAEPYSVQVNAGNVYVLRAPWTRRFIDEHRNYPVGKHLDQVDAAGGAFNKLVLGKTGNVGVW